MGKKNKKDRAQLPPVSAPALDGISSLGKKVISAGVALLVLGFIVLSFTDPMGRNWASQLSPFLILGGYAVIAAGIFVPEKLPTSGGVSPPSEPQKTI